MNLSVKLSRTVGKMIPYIFQYLINNVGLERLQIIKDLGVTFDISFSFADHIDKLVTSCSKILGFVIRNCSNFNNEFALKSLYFSLIRSKMEYCSLVWFPIYQIHIYSLEKIQKKFLKILSFKCHRFYPPQGYEYNLLLQEFSLLSLDCRRKISAVVFAVKLFDGTIN